MSEVGKGKGAHAGLARYGVDAEVWQMLPKVFTDLYEELYTRALGGALGLKGGVDGKQGGGKPGDHVLTEVRLKVRKVEAESLAEWCCEGYSAIAHEPTWRMVGEVCGTCGSQYLPNRGIETRLSGLAKLVVTEGPVIPVGKAQRVRVTTSEKSKDGKVTMGGARSAGKNGSGKDWITDERALRWKDRVDRALRRVVRDIRKDMEQVGKDKERVCSRSTGYAGLVASREVCGRPAEPNWLYCPHCGAPTREA